MRRILFLLSVIIMSGCAKIVTPTGGPKDTKPPEIVKEEPENKSTLFTDKIIKITFNEFVVLDNPTEKILFSPPLAHTPDYSLSKKSLVIKLKDTLRSNTTYNIGFAGCIKDFTEGNVLSFFNYTFSTGSYIDSFCITGIVHNALTLEPEKNCFVFLYEENTDSLPLTKRPTYITKTSSSGQFTFNNIKEGEYKIFALNDRNNNLLFDLTDESIAFLDHLVKAVPQVENKKDTVAAKQDSISGTVKKDSISEARKANSVHLTMFTEKDTVQRFVKQTPVKKGMYTFIYRKPVTDFSIKALDSAVKVSYFQVIAQTKDTVTLYLKEMIKDSVYLELTADTIVDTVAIVPYKPVQRGLIRTKEKNEPLTVSASNLGELYRPFTLNFSYPIKPVDSFDITIIRRKKAGNDTLVNRYSVPDTFVSSMQVPFKIEQKTSYTFIVQDSVFEGYNGSLNDSLVFNFTTKTEKDYGNLSMNYNIPADKAGTQYVISLLSSDNKLVKTDIIESSKKITYTNLIPGNYKIKVIEDTNRNGEWDTGNYRKKIQPEQIFFFQKTITIRGYWDLEEVFNFPDQN